MVSIRARCKNVSIRLTQIKKSPNDAWCACRIHALHVDLDRFELLALVEVEDEILRHSEPIADDDER